MLGLGQFSNSCVDLYKQGSSSYKAGIVEIRGVMCPIRDGSDISVPV